MKKIGILILCLALSVVMVAGCSQVPDQTSADPSSPGAAEKTAAAGSDGTVSAGDFAVQPKNGDKFRVGVVIKTLESPFYQNMAKALENEYADSDTYEIILQASKTETDTAGFIQIIEDMITKDVDVLIVVPGDPDAVAPTLENVVAAGIPVICVETDVPSLEGKLTYIGIDNVSGGAAVVQYMFDEGYVKEGDEMALITGPVGYTTTTDRAQGAKNAVEKNGGVLVSEQPADWDRQKGLDVAENILTANPNLKYIIASNSQMAVGAAEAVASAQKTGEIFITGFDGVMDEFTAIQDGRLIATALQPSDQYGLLAMEKLDEYLKGSTLEEVYYVDSPLITKDNVQEFIDASIENQ